MGTGTSSRVKQGILLAWLLGLSACGTDATDPNGLAADGGGLQGFEGEGAMGGTYDLEEWPEVDPAEAFSLVLPTQTLDPGQEGYICIRARVPEAFRGQDLALMGWDSDLPLGTHHFFLSWVEEAFPGSADEDVVPCQDGDPYIDVTDSPSGGSAEQFLNLGGKILFGEGVGMHHVDTSASGGKYGSYMSKDGYMATNAHVINLSTEPIEVGGRFHLYAKPAQEVPFVTQMVNCLASNIDIAPGEQATVEGTCTAPFDMDIVTLGSHAHQYLDLFQLRLFRDGEVMPEVIYENSDWDSPAILPQTPPIHLKEGDGLSFKCDYTNYSDQRVRYAYGGPFSEMCAFMGGFAYPEGREGEVPPHLGALLGSSAPGAMLDTGSVPGVF